MNRSLKAAAVIAAIGLLAAFSAGAAPRGMGPGASGRWDFDDDGGPGACGPGMMRGPGAYGPGVMGGGGYGVPGWQNLKKLDKPLTADTAKGRVLSALKDWGYTGLAVDTVVEYGAGFYALVKDPSSGQAALELFVDPVYGTVSAGRGPEAAWNTKYGRDLRWPQPSGSAISADQAKTAAQEWLNRAGAPAYDLKVVELPGYFSIQLVQNGKLVGLAAVNAYTRQVWYRGNRGARWAGAGGFGTP
jgi:hypothetical protein